MQHEEIVHYQSEQLATVMLNPLNEVTADAKARRRKKTPINRVKKVDKGAKGSFKYVRSQAALEWLEETFAVAEILELQDSIVSHGNWLSAAVRITVMDKFGIKKTVQRFGCTEAVISPTSKITIPPVKSAMSDAIKRCCVALGGFRDVYGEIEAEESGQDVDSSWFVSIVLPLAQDRFENEPDRLIKLICSYSDGRISKEQLIKSFNL